MTHLEELLYCLEANYPAPVTQALLTLIDNRKKLVLAHDAWTTWGELDDDDFLEAVNTVTEASAWFCDDCQALVWHDNTTTVASGDRVCDESCLVENYYTCDQCSDLVQDTTSVGDGASVCQYCLDRDYTRCRRCEEYNTYTITIEGSEYCESCRDYFSWCEECEEYYDPDGEGHDHGCECNAPHPYFEFPANGQGTIGENERLLVELPKGTIDDEGLTRIRKLLRLATEQWEITDAVLESVGDAWQTKRGNFTRRLSSAFFSQHRIKLDAGVISEVGNIARAHSSDGATWHIEVTRDLNLSADEFYHEDSCWWGGYTKSRCALKNWGGLGMRTYNDMDVESYHPSGRIWIQPLDADMKPSHDTLGARAYVIFNGYGDLSGPKAARIIGHLTSRTYRQIDYSAGEQYINNGTAYLVADEATCEATNSLSFRYTEHNEQDAHTYNLKAAA